MSGPALTSLTAIPTVAEGDTARSNAKPMPPYPYGWRLRLRLCLMPCLDASASYFHRRHSTHRLISRHCPEDSGVPLFYTPQTSPLGRNQMYYTKRLSDSSLSYRFSALSKQRICRHPFSPSRTLISSFIAISTSRFQFAR